jgi:hypothetical protein
LSLGWDRTSKQTRCDPHLRRWLSALGQPSVEPAQGLAESLRNIPAAQPAAEIRCPKGSRQESPNILGKQSNRTDRASVKEANYVNPGVGGQRMLSSVVDSSLGGGENINYVSWSRPYENGRSQ